LERRPSSLSEPTRRNPTGEAVEEEEVLEVVEGVEGWGIKRGGNPMDPFKRQ